MVEIKNLTFSYDNRRYIFKNLSFKLNDNGIYYLSGKNGTGKSTLFKILKGIIKTKNNIYINGVLNDYSKVTYIDYKYVIENGLTVEEYLLLFSNDTLYVNTLMEEFNLIHIKQSLTKDLSDGEKTRLAFVQGMLENNDIILIDEIFSHLDDVSLEVIIKYIYMMSKNKIIIFTNHNENIDISCNFLLDMKYNNIILSKSDFINNSQVFNTKDYFINIKTLNKVISSKINYIYMVFNILLILFLSFFVYIVSYDSLGVYHKTLLQTKSNPYIVNNISSQSLTYLTNDDIDYDLNSDNYQIFSDVFGSGLITDFNLDGNDPSEYQFKVDRIFVTDKYNNKKINDNEIIISDFINHMLRKLDEEATYSYVLNDVLFIKFRGATLKVVDVLDTGFNFDEEVEINTIINNGIKMETYKYKLNSFRSNYYYFNMYVNQNTINKIKENYYMDLNNSIALYNNSVCDIVVPNKDDIIIGRLPQNNNEIVLPISEENNQLDNIKHIYFQLGPKEYLHTSGLIYLTKFININLHNLVVVGYTKDKIGFSSQKNIDNLINSISKYHIEQVIDLSKFTIKDLKKIKNDNYYIISDNYYEIENNLLLFDQIQKNSNFIIVLFVVIFLITNGLFIYIYNNHVFKGIKYLTYKNIKRTIIFKQLFKYYSKLVLILIVLMISLSSFILFYNLYEQIIFKIIGII